MCNMKCNAPAQSFLRNSEHSAFPLFLKLFKTVHLWRTFHSLFIPASVLLSSFLSFSLILLSMTLPPSPTNGCFNCCLSTLCEVLIVPRGATSLLSSNTHTNKEPSNRVNIEQTLFARAICDSQMWIEFSEVKTNFTHTIEVKHQASEVDYDSHSHHRELDCES